jgi:hypothetical protein
MEFRSSWQCGRGRNTGLPTRTKGRNAASVLAKNIGVELKSQPDVRLGKNDARVVRTSDGQVFFGARGAAGAENMQNRSATESLIYASGWDTP